MADKTVRRAHHAKIYVNTPFYVGSIETSCLPDALYDLLIGNTMVTLSIYIYVYIQAANYLSRI